MSKERRWSVENTTVIRKLYANSDGVYFVTEGRKYLVICDGERHVSVVLGKMGNGHCHAILPETLGFLDQLCF
jgi:hypothetical protein